MAIIETKADQLMALIDRQRIISEKVASKTLGVSDDYVRRIAEVLHRNNLIELKVNAFSLTMIAKDN
jgi:hypothetical protein